MGLCCLSRPENNRRRIFERGCEYRGVREIGSGVRNRARILARYLANDGINFSDPWMSRIGPHRTDVHNWFQRNIVTQFGAKMFLDARMFQAWNAPDIDSDFRPIWHGVDVMAGVERCQHLEWASRDDRVARH